MEFAERVKNDLNPEQQEAVTTTDGPVLVLAGAGSGKTKALTYRIAYLLSQGVQPHEILAVTFTNKAAGEMQERVLKLVGKQSLPGLIISTFHSFGARMLRQYADRFDREPGFSIFDESDQQTAIKQIYKKLHLSTDHIKPTSVIYQISGAKNEMVDPDEYETLARGEFQNTTANIYKEYEKLLRANNAFDFDDLITKFVSGLEKDDELKQMLQTRFKYILVDEYQDTNTAQYRLVKMLAAKHKNIFVVGDDWQSIYSWRGANFRNILQFHEDYPAARIIKLEQNYRSTSNILEAAQAIIERNVERSDKKLWTEAGDGDQLMLKSFYSEKEEADWIAGEIDRLQNAGVALNEIAILYRTNAQSRLFEEKLIYANIPYRLYGGVRFYARKEIKDALAYLTLLANPVDAIAGYRAISSPSRGVGEKTWEKIREHSWNNDVPLYEAAAELGGSKARNFYLTFQTARELLDTKPLSEIFDFLIKNSGYADFLNDGTIEGESRIENVAELKSVMEKYDSLDGKEALELFLQEVSLLSSADEDNVKLGVSLMTMHAAKGLEFDFVFIAGLEEGLFPHIQSLDDNSRLEEERRLMYVALTRARKKVFMSHAHERLIFGKRNSNLPSRFLSEIPEGLVHKDKPTRTADTSAIWGEADMWDTVLHRGDYIHHTHFGEGQVLNIVGDIAEIRFNRFGVKRIQLPTPTLSKLD